MDFYILTESAAHFGAQQSAYKYPLLTILDKAGDFVFSISHGYTMDSFSPGSRYKHSFQFKSNYQVRDKHILESDFYRTSSTKISIRFQKAVQSKTKLVVNLGKSLLSFFWMYEEIFPLAFDDFDQFIVGKRARGQSASPMFAYFFNALHILIGRFAHLELSTQAFKAYHGLGLAPYHVVSNPSLWFLPENPDELSAYSEALKSASDTAIAFGNLPCPPNCEICFDSAVCLVCRSFYALNSSGECDWGYSFPDSFTNVFGRSGITSDHSTKTKMPMTGLDTDSAGYSRMRLYIELEKTVPALTGTDEATCYIENNLGERVYDYINWNFNNKSVSPYSDYSVPLENRLSKIKIKPQNSLTSISKGTCEIHTFTSYYFKPTCEPEYLSTPSLKGYLGLKFCAGVYVNVTDSPYMITPEAGFTPGDYDYVIPVPGTSGFVYGKCKNNCKCWDGDLHTSKGYNSCFVNPSTGNICEGSKLINYSLDKSRQACVDTAVIDAFKSCEPNCDVCDSVKTCTKCSQITHNRNFLDLDFYGLYCGSCHVDCLSCYGASSSDCWCSSTQFGPGNTRFDFDFNLCLPVAHCGSNCADCRSTGCVACGPDHYFDDVRSKCHHVMSLNCMFRNGIHDCIDCLPGQYLESGTCRKCSSNCRVCFAATCSVCSDGYLLIENKCISYYFLATAQTVKQLDLPQDVHISKINTRRSILGIRYRIHFIYLPAVESYVEYDDFIRLTSEPTTKFKTNLEHSNYLQALAVQCNMNGFTAKQFNTQCDASTDSHAIATVTSNITSKKVCSELLPGCAQCVSQ